MLLISSAAPSPRSARPYGRPDTSQVLAGCSAGSQKGGAEALPSLTAPFHQHLVHATCVMSLRSQPSGPQHVSALEVRPSCRGGSGRQSTLDTIAEQSCGAEGALSLAVLAAACKPDQKLGGSPVPIEAESDAIGAHYGGSVPALPDDFKGALQAPAGRLPTSETADIEPQPLTSSIVRSAGLLLTKLKALGRSKTTPLPAVAIAPAKTGVPAAATPASPRAPVMAMLQSSSMARSQGVLPTVSRSSSVSRPKASSPPHTSSFSVKVVLPPVNQTSQPPEQPAPVGVQQQQQQQDTAAVARQHLPAGPLRMPPQRGAGSPSLAAGAHRRGPGPGLPPRNTPVAAGRLAGSPSSPASSRCAASAVPAREVPHVEPRVGSGSRGARSGRPSPAGKAAGEGRGMGSLRRSPGSPTKEPRNSSPGSGASSGASRHAVPVLRGPSFSKVAARVDTGMRARRGGASPFAKAPSSPGGVKPAGAATTVRGGSPTARTAPGGVQRSAKSWSAASSGKAGLARGERVAAHVVGLGGAQGPHQLASRRLAMYTLRLHSPHGSRPVSPGKGQQQQQQQQV